MTAFRNVVASQNTAQHGGVLSVSLGVVVVSGMLAYNNSAAQIGGALYCFNCEVLGVQLDSMASIGCLSGWAPPSSSLSFAPVVAPYDGKNKQPRQYDGE